MSDFNGANAVGLVVQVAYPGDEIFSEVNSDYDVSAEPDVFGLLLGDEGASGFLMDGTLQQIRETLLLALRRVDEAIDATTGGDPDVDAEIERRERAADEAITAKERDGS